MTVTSNQRIQHTIYIIIRMRTCVINVRTYADVRAIMRVCMVCAKVARA